ncbi:plasmid pRiA4b ORF-3 family protein [uncultured Bacteroides sp.]|uniref:plasmid pRiA4b ORF-3 family protein n=1 Tax=uncultured Bacteroides sp. TaxID=162156 RepID=UPI0025EADFBF|nr:plasmid pRiA4b ORF-3 family protein [uncultured Bacteroides sp.]
MAKKEMTPEELFTELMNTITPEEKKRAIEMLQCTTDTSDSDYSEMYYHYQCPDYKLQTKPLARYLVPLWEQEEFDDVFKNELLLQCSSVPQDELVRELRNLTLKVFVDYKETKDRDYPYRLLGGFWLMEHYVLEDCLDVVLESLRQDIDFIESFLGYDFEEIPPLLICRIGINRLDELSDFMQESGLLPIAKVKVVEAMTQIAKVTPENRLKVIDWFCKVLNCFLERTDIDDCDSIAINFMSQCLLKIKGVEALPVLEKIFKRFDVSSDDIPDFKTLKKKMSHSEMRVLEFSSVDECITAYENELNGLEVDYDDSDEDKSLYIESDSVKKLCLKIAIEGLSPSIWRTLEVPSNIRLGRFADVVKTAMGWSGCLLHQFMKGKCFYLAKNVKDDDVYLPAGYQRVDSNEIALGELLNRKGVSLAFEYDFGDSWMHKITVESRQDYKIGETPSIKLLDGANACPPEDCGGIFGYIAMQNALKYPRSKAVLEYNEWFNEDFNPFYFDLEDTKKRLEAFVE